MIADEPHLAAALRDAGLEVWHAADEISLTAQRNAIAPNLIVLDQTCLTPAAQQRLGLETGQAHCPLLILSDALPAITDRALTIDPLTDWLVKPVTPTQLLHHLLRFAAFARLLYSHHHLQQLTQIAPWVWIGAEQRIEWSPTAQQMLPDCTNNTQSLAAWLQQVPDSEQERVERWFRELEHQQAQCELTHPLQTPNGDLRYLRHFAAPSGAQARIEGAVQEVTTQHQAEQHVQRLAYFDSLTGLPNRAFFLKQLDHVVHAATRYQRCGALLFLDLDNFKKVNDTLGHHVGDLLLQSVAERLLSCLRSSDIMIRFDDDYEAVHYLARLGGDEFTILLPELRDGRDAARVAERIIKALDVPFTLDGHDVVVTPSVGITVFPADGLSTSDLLRNGDMAMYHAKHSGKNTYQFFDTSLNEAALYRLNIENALRQALVREQFQLYFQPQIDAITGEVLGMEALLRWSHPEFGAVSPMEFIPITEETGLGLSIGEWVLTSACEQLCRWQAAGSRIQRVAVNLSATQFASAEFPAQVARILATTGLAAQCLELEITETILMQQAEKSINTLNALKKLGVTLAIDDFGAGYSSLGYLKRFAIDRLKIDKSFVDNIDCDRDNAAIAQAVIALAVSMSIRVTAEGVETDHQLQFLRQRSCQEVQGYLFSQPLPADQVPEQFLGVAPLES